MAKIPFQAALTRLKMFGWTGIAANNIRVFLLTPPGAVIAAGTDLQAGLAAMAIGGEDGIPPKYGVEDPASPVSATLVALRQDRVVGQITIGLDAEGDYPAEIAPWLSGVFVDADHRGSGVGAALADTATLFLIRLLENAMREDPGAWKWFDPHISGDLNPGSEALARRINAKLEPIVDEVLDRFGVERLRPEQAGQCPQYCVGTATDGTRLAIDVIVRLLDEDGTGTIDLRARNGDSAIAASRIESRDVRLWPEQLLSLSDAAVRERLFAGKGAEIAGAFLAGPWAKLREMLADEIACEARAAAAERPADVSL